MSSGGGFTIVPTHDVDAFHPIGNLRLLKRIVETRQFDELSAFVTDRESPYRTFERICEINQRYDATSTFFFLRDHGPNDSNYDFTDDGVPETIARLQESGNEIGLHASRASHTNYTILLKEKELLESVTGSPIESIRQHSHWLDKFPARTFELQQLAGFKYDCTFVPQKYGERRHFHPFQAVSGLIEFPLSISDRNFHAIAGTADKDHSDVWRRIELILDRYRRNEGTCCISWHPHAFYDGEKLASRLFYPHFEGFDELYERVLRYGHDHGADIVSLSTAGEQAKVGDPWW